MDESLKARRVVVHVSIGGHDATDAIKPDLLEFAFVDNAKGKADEISLSLADPEGKWSGAWKPKKGMPVSANLTAMDWTGPGQHLTLPMGGFVVDKVSLSGPPDKLTISAVSAFKTTAMSEEVNTKGWENVTLREIAGEIAGKHGLELMYDAPDHDYVRVDQREESDITYLHRLCKDRGVNLKVHDGKMILYGAKEWDAKAPSMIINRKEDQFSPSRYSFDENAEGTFQSADVAYHDPEAEETYTANVPADGEPPSGQMLKLNERVESAGAAIALGTSALREHNENADTANITVMGCPGLVAGITVTMSGFGAYDGAYFVEKAEHKVGGSGYTTSADLRRTLGY
ncbi:hypothetical protein LJC71_04985 [Desulfosarcina sp. OttesenSCG-928-A07]|nr:hypothetical protein [Desulfosarcina sp. OttesenSCG-928-G17]MDL2329093.1 hypothetical protein [Desulfosarcina sp. OttesenSCG-928-A07]